MLGVSAFVVSRRMLAGIIHGHIQDAQASECCEVHSLARRACMKQPTENSPRLVNNPG